MESRLGVLTGKTEVVFRRIAPATAAPSYPAPARPTTTPAAAYLPRAAPSLPCSNQLCAPLPQCAASSPTLTYSRTASCLNSSVPSQPSYFLTRSSPSLQYDSTTSCCRRHAKVVTLEKDVIE
ncbi:hypothetical protein Pmani_032561 [Petrolisthes manimaculis]|uniref:Uncharacterized protein n=1 Tax=Petrolisthes manimaculis TaxID=1843537 RepID=A0AAE1NT46_9EUCA|nr:hypothetical protein Pmani_032561 [Petrolisthes manimaculis]